jgi:hypothetical protein
MKPTATWRFAGFSLLAVTGLAVSWAVLRADEPNLKDEKAAPKKTALQTFMRRKLESSQKILEGLAVEDFDLIAQGAKDLKGISAAAEFVVSKDALYTQHANEFRRIVDRLEKTAKEKRLDGSALSYMDLTMSCIECHRFVRNVLIAGGGQ